MEIIRKEMKLCMSCMEEHEVEIVRRSECSVYKGEEVDYEAVYEYCDRTQEYLEMEDMISQNDIAMKNAYRRKKGLLTTEDILAIRRKYNISQSDLAKMLGCGEKTITRYESHQIQDVVYDKMLKKIDTDPEWFLTLLKESRGSMALKAYERYYINAANILRGQKDDYLRKSILAQYAEYIDNEDYCGNKEPDLDVVVDTVNYLARRVQELYLVKLVKLMWYADALSFKRYDHSITGLAYQKMPMGTVPIAYQSIIQLEGINYEEIEFDNGGIGLKFHDSGRIGSGLTDDNKKILDDVIRDCGNISRRKIVERIHGEKAYMETCENRVIPYHLAKDLSLA